MEYIYEAFFNGVQVAFIGTNDPFAIAYLKACKEAFLATEGMTGIVWAEKKFSPLAHCAFALAYGKDFYSKENPVGTGLTSEFWASNKAV